MKDCYSRPDAVLFLFLHFGAVKTGNSESLFCETLREVAPVFPKKNNNSQCRIGLFLCQNFLIFILMTSVLIRCRSGEDQRKADQFSTQVKIDTLSYNLGVIGGFAEIVDAGIKRLALSAALDPDEMNAIEGEARLIAERNHVQIYRERDFLVTDLFPPDVTEGKHVLLIYKDATLDAYLALKKEKAMLDRSGAYAGAARQLIARKMGALLSYPDERINTLLQNRNRED